MQGRGRRRIVGRQCSQRDRRPRRQARWPSNAYPNNGNMAGPEGKNSSCVAQSRLLVYEWAKERASPNEEIILPASSGAPTNTWPRRSRQWWPGTSSRYVEQEVESLLQNLEPPCARAPGAWLEHLRQVDPGCAGTHTASATLSRVQGRGFQLVRGDGFRICEAVTIAAHAGLEILQGRPRTRMRPAYHMEGATVRSRDRRGPDVRCEVVRSAASAAQRNGMAARRFSRENPGNPGSWVQVWAATSPAPLRLRQEVQHCPWAVWK